MRGRLRCPVRDNPSTEAVFRSGFGADEIGVVQGLHGARRCLLGAEFAGVFHEFVGRAVVAALKQARRVFGTIVDRSFIDNAEIAVAEVFQAAGETAADGIRRNGMAAVADPPLDLAEAPSGHSIS